MRDTKKVLRKKIVYFKEKNKFAQDYFCIEVVSFFLLIKDVVLKIKNSIFPPKYRRYEKYV